MGLGAHLLDWLALALRWAHFIAGVAWIGASFYFNWLENRLQRQNQPDGIAGELWAIHGGGFYHLRKHAVAPATLPAELHWFKWEAYATWLSGFALLVVVYWLNASAMLAGPTLTPGVAIAASFGILVASWLVYDGLCRVFAGHHDAWLAASVLAWFTVLAWFCGEWFSPRAAWLHVGAAIGTVMVANVAHVIIPAQRRTVAALVAGEVPDPAPGQAALTRSRHNNYLTLPVLFIMVSAHFPAAFGHAQAWAVLLSVSLAGVAVRHYFNVRHLGGKAWAWLAGGLLLLLATALVTAPRPAATTANSGRPPVSTETALGIVQARCASCHAQTPSQAGFVAPPLGVVLTSADELVRHRDRVRQTLVTRTMPLGNLTGMTDAERQTVVDWSLQQ